MNNWYEKFAGLGNEIVHKTRFNNALGSPLILTAIITPLSIVGYSITKLWPLILISLIPPIYFIRAFDFLMKNNPKLLRTEEHEEKMLQIRMGIMGEKDGEMSEQAIDVLPAIKDVPKIDISKKKNK